MDEKFKQKTVSAEELASKLNNSSPLQASKILIETELFEKKSSLEVLDEIYDHFENKGDLIDELLTPVGLNLLDGVVSHKKLGLNRTGLTASRLWSEIQGFEYSTVGVNDSSLSSKQQLEAMREPRDYERSKLDNVSRREKHKNEHFAGKDRADSSIEVDSEGNSLILNKNNPTGRDKLSAETDHLVTVKQFNNEFGNNCYLTDSDMKGILNSDENFIQISKSLNASKGEGSFTELKNKKQSNENPNAVYSNVSDETLEEGIKREEVARSEMKKMAREAAWKNIEENKEEILKKSGSQALEQSSYQLIGTALIEIIKPLFFEIIDSIKNGFETGVGAANMLEAIKLRFTRLMMYVNNSVIPTLSGFFKNLISNISKILIEGVVGIFEGMFHSIMKVISEGFSAIISAIKILCNNSGEMTSAQKGDAIVKLLASTVTTFVVFNLSQPIETAFKGLGPLSFIGDIIVAIASGVASTLVVYLIDKLDLFSVKYEKRSKLVAEIFQERISTIKKNTDAFNAASVQELAAHKVAFKKLYEDFESGIDNDFDVTSNVNSIADFMKVDLKIRDTESFLDILKREKVLVI